MQMSATTYLTYNTWMQPDLSLTTLFNNQRWQQRNIVWCVYVEGVAAHERVIGAKLRKVCQPAHVVWMMMVQVERASQAAWY